LINKVPTSPFHGIFGRHRAYIIAEVAQSHEGSLGFAHSFIDAAAEAGADAIKFQTHIAAAESTLDEPFRVNFGSGDTTRYDYWRRMEFSREQWRELAAHARKRNLDFFSSAFSLEAVEMLAELNMPAWKIASGEVATPGLLERMAALNPMFLVSTGLSSWAEIDDTVTRLRNIGANFAIMQCTSRYPTQMSDVGLNVIDAIRGRFGCPAGLSDHSGTVFPSLAALARGADLLELHITLDRRMFGPDVPASLTVEELKLVTQARDAFAEMDANPVDKDAMARELASARKLFTKSVALARPLPAGAVLSADDLTFKKPGTGIPAARMAELIGRALARDVRPDRLLVWDDLRD